MKRAIEKEAVYETVYTIDGVLTCVVFLTSDATRILMDKKKLTIAVDRLCEECKKVRFTNVKYLNLWRMFFEPGGISPFTIGSSFHVQIESLMFSIRNVFLIFDL